MTTQKGVVWKEAWLGRSETFIRDQIASMMSWNFLKLGFHQTDDPLILPDYAPYGNGFLDRWNRRLFGTALHRSEYSQRIQDFDASIIHAHFLTGGMTVASLASKLSLPLVTTLHNPRILAYQYGVSRSLQGVFARKLASTTQATHGFVAVSRYVADAAIDAGLPRDKVAVVHIGTPIVPQQHSALREGIVFAGRLIEMKGPRDLLLAINRLPSRLRRVPVTVVGDGPLRPDLERIARDFGLNVHFTGWLPSWEMPAIFAKHKIFCGPSKADSLGVREGFGMVYLEAALQGLPIVAYKSGGVTDAVLNGGTGLLADEGNLEGLSSALSELLQDGAKAAEMGAAGRRRVEADFDINKQSASLKSLFNELV